jgi:UDP-N-acetylmuramate: L-alanyl-gamma-D-glutamyl-meso-diaminopimelate ligase
VLAVAGTHGKTTTTSMLAWILEHAGLAPGFLVGGVPQNFGISARTGDLAAIETQFHHLVRVVPSQGLLVVNGNQAALERVLARGSWTPVERFGAGHEWSVGAIHPDDSFDVCLAGGKQGVVRWGLMGDHNRQNALAALAAARHAGVPVKAGIEALGRFEGVKRRMEVRGVVNGITVYDDFAHHPTAFETTIAGLRRRVGDSRIVAVFEPRSNTMKLGTMQDRLASSLSDADLVFCFAKDLGWDPSHALAALGTRAFTHIDMGTLVETLARALKPGDHVLVMSNGSFGGVHAKLLERLGAISSRTGA